VLAMFPLLAAKVRSIKVECDETGQVREGKQRRTVFCR
jgi:hypothetical protein